MKLKSKRLFSIARWLFISILFLMIFGWFSVRVLKKDRHRKELNLAERVIKGFIEIPDKANDLLSGKMKKQAHPQCVWDAKADIGFLDVKSQDKTENGFLLYSSIDEKGSHSVILLNLQTGTIRHQWPINVKFLLAQMQNVFKKYTDEYKESNTIVELKSIVNSPKSESALYISNPLLLADSSLIFGTGPMSPLYRIDKTGKLIWQTNCLSHHTFELDAQNNLWVCSIDLYSTEAKQQGIKDDAILKLNIKTGAVIYKKSLSNIFRSNQLLIDLVYTHKYRASRDAFHLNDIQPTINSGLYWKKGDLFLSIRNLSLVMLYRPSNDSVLWHKTGPWLSQHDVDILDSSRISVFNNNVPYGHAHIIQDFKKNITSYSNVIIYDFKNKISYPYLDSLFMNSGIFSRQRGRAEIQNDGSIFVESTDQGFYYLLDQSGIKWKTYTPYMEDDNKVMLPCWARYLKLENGIFVE